MLATVLSCNGQPTIKRAGRSDTIPLTPQVSPGTGDLIQAPASSQARLCLLPNLLVQIDRAAELEIRQLTITKDGNETGNAILARSAAVRLVKGRMFVSHVWGEAMARFTVETPNGQLIVISNALFCIETEPEKTRITCASGLIDFQPKGSPTSTRISAGFVGETSGGTLNLNPADTDPLAQESLLDALQAEQKLRELASARRNVLPR